MFMLLHSKAKRYHDWPHLFCCCKHAFSFSFFLSLLFEVPCSQMSLAVTSTSVRMREVRDSLQICGSQRSSSSGEHHVSRSLKGICQPGVISHARHLANAHLGTHQAANLPICTHTVLLDLLPVTRQLHNSLQQHH